VELTTHAERGRLGGLTTAARHDGRAQTAKARAAFMADGPYWLDYVDPSGDLRQKDYPEALRRADAARRLHYQRMAYASLRSRRRVQLRLAANTLRSTADMEKPLVPATGPAATEVRDAAATPQ